MGSILPAQHDNYDGQTTPKSGGQTGAKGGGQFKPKSGGQTHRNFQIVIKLSFFLINSLFCVDLRPYLQNRITFTNN